VGYWTSIAVDSGNLPHISHAGLYGTLRYTHWDGSIWQSEIVLDEYQGIYQASYGYTSIALDGNDGVHLSAGRVFPLSNDRALLYATQNGGTWDTVVVDSNALTPGASHVGENSALALDPTTGVPRISYARAGVPGGSLWYTEAPIPEPSTGLLLLGTLLGIGWQKPRSVGGT